MFSTNHNSLIIPDFSKGKNKNDFPVSAFILDWKEFDDHFRVRWFIGSTSPIFNIIASSSE